MTGERRGIWRSRRWRWLALLVASVAVLSAAAARLGPALVISQQPSQVDAIVSLASHEWERLPAAAALAAAFPAASVLITEPPVITPLTCHDCAHRVEALERLGVARSRVSMVAVDVQGTYGEALGTLRVAQRAGIRHLVVVTSPYHARRSLATFQKVFAGTPVEVGVAPAMDISHADPADWWRHGYDRHYVFYEWTAILYYRLRYGV